jgi:hypothetical protein
MHHELLHLLCHEHTTGFRVLAAKEETTTNQY